MDESGMIDLPSTPTRAKSEGPISPHRSPMEDANSSGTRKRPRLDSGERTYRSMSADRLSTSPAERLPTTTQASSTSPTNMVSAAAPFTPTKVTINVREPALGNVLPAPTAESTAQTTLHGEKKDKASPSQQSDSPKIESIHSSPAHSPEIQVAEVEDISDEPAVTRWQPLKSRLSEARNVQQNLLYDFPFQGHNKSLRRTVSTVAVAWEKSMFRSI